MRLHSSLLSQGPGVSLRIGTDPVVGSEEAALLIGVTGQAVRSGCAADRYKGARKDQTGAWHIPLSALPHLAQARYWAKNSAVAPGGWSEDDRRELPEEEIAELWRRFEGQSETTWRSTALCP